MNLEQLKGRYSRLKQELATAYSTLPWNSGRIDRLTDELASTEFEMSAALGLRPRANDTLRHAA